MNNLHAKLLKIQMLIEEVKAEHKVEAENIKITLGVSPAKPYGTDYTLYAELEGVSEAMNEALYVYNEHHGYNEEDGEPLIPHYGTMTKAQLGVR